MFSHVCGENSLDDHVSSALEVRSTHLDCPITMHVFTHQLERGCQVMVLQHAYVVVPHSYLIIHHDKEGVIDSWVLVIVHGSRYETAHELEVVQL